MKGKYKVEFFVLKVGETLWELKSEEVEAYSAYEAWEVMAEKLEDENGVVSFRIVDALDVTTLG